MPSSRRRLTQVGLVAAAVGARAGPVLEGYDMVSFKPGAGVTGVMGKSSIA